MTTGHKHRHVKLRPESIAFRVLRHPLRTTTFEKAERSRFVWGAESLDSPVWTLSLLGIAHTLFGLTIEVKE